MPFSINKIILSLFIFPRETISKVRRMRIGDNSYELEVVTTLTP